VLHNNDYTACTAISLPGICFYNSYEEVILSSVALILWNRQTMSCHCDSSKT